MESATEFARNAHQNGVETRIVRSVKEIENPFTWRTGKPQLVAARKQIDSNFLILYAQFTDDGTIMDNALVSADCSERRMRLVSHSIYEKHQSETGYDIFGRTLPVWAQATYYDMLAVKLTQPPVAAYRGMFFEIACNWEKLTVVDLNDDP